LDIHRSYVVANFFPYVLAISGQPTFHSARQIDENTQDTRSWLLLPTIVFIFVTWNVPEGVPALLFCVWDWEEYRAGKKRRERLPRDCGKLISEFGPDPLH